MRYGDWIGRWAKSNPAKEALVDAATGRRYTYGDLARDVHRAANFLRDDLSVAKGGRVAVLAHNRAETIVLFFAASRIGAILVPLNFRMPAAELRYFVEDAAPAVFFYDRANQPAAAQLQPIGIIIILNL